MRGTAQMHCCADGWAVEPRFKERVTCRSRILLQRLSHCFDIIVTKGCQQRIFAAFGRGVVGADELVTVTWSASVATTNSSSVSSSNRRGQHGIRGGVDAMKFSCPCGTGEGLRPMLSDRGEGSKGDSPWLDALVEHSDPR